MGNSTHYQEYLLLPTVHPHVHGELSTRWRESDTVGGSSPRAWGTQVLSRSNRLLVRFIPTCMGNSRACAGAIRHRPVHPHVHGELLTGGSPGVTIFGSSPRAWGTQERRVGEEVEDRFIPTCMGNSSCAASIRLRRSVHPHVHGELTIAAARSDNPLGSSPRAWGTPGAARLPGRRRRFIPTCMGNSPSSSRATSPYTVHPHVHGELIPIIVRVPGEAGSSPRAWGTPRRSRAPGRSSRFIPTCMGNSRAGRRVHQGGPVHPHVHGELRPARGCAVQRHGSSPRAWGTPHHIEVGGLRDRFIPTCMGNSG